jgi:1-aminocyclopropane-1-carboxylate deaminase/D-cysteine desulfhydrase-like pyridoxal-dependent ACC family enzyme
MAVTLPARFPLAVLPTPLVRARHLERALASPPIYVKRDDLAGFGFAGNKARKLEYIISDALDRGAKVMVTGGGPSSNHCASTAAAARVAGLGCLLILYGVERGGDHPSLSLARSFGAEVRFTNNPDRSSVDEAIEEVVAELENQGQEPYAVPRGGATVLGAAGCALAAEELCGQLDLVDAKPATVILPTGSCGTQAGFVAATAAYGDALRVIGASVSRPVEECRRRVLQLARGCASLLEMTIPDERRVHLIDARGPGFGLPSSEGVRAARLAAYTEGLLLDSTYTAKAFAVLLDLVASGKYGTTVFFHSGGLPAALWDDQRTRRPEPSLA